MSAARTVTARFAPLNPLAACTVTRSTATVAQIPSGHPRVLMANAELKACLQRQMQYSAPVATRMKSYVDAQMASGNIYGFEPWFAALGLPGHAATPATPTTRWQRTDAFVASRKRP